MDLAEIVALLRQAPADLQQELETLVEEGTRDMVWVPNPGPQTEAYFSDADELFYGGQAGGGKTDLELGLALTQHDKALILRRTNKEVQGLAERMTGILGSRDGFNSQTGTWRRPNGATIELGGCQLESDKQKYKGNPHDLICVGPETEVLMGDGSYREIKHIEPGEYVQTLEGPRLVKRAFPIFGKESVALTVDTPNGRVVQIQSSTHKVLSRNGWGAPDRLNDAQSLRYEPGTTQYRYPDIFYANISGTPSSVSPVLRKKSWWARSTELLRLIAPGTSALGNLSEKNEYRVLRDQENDSAASGGARPTLWRQVLRCCVFAKAAIRCQHLGPAHAPCSSPAHGVCDGRASLALVDYQDYYRIYPRSCGGRIPFHEKILHALKTARSYLQRLIGVGLRNPKHSPMDVQDCTHRCNRPQQEYPHPYNSGTRSSQLPLTSCSYTITPIGKMDLFDLEVEEVNHFITKGGIVNKNCFDEISDFTETQYTFISGWNRSAKKGQRCRIVGAGNPPTRPEGLWVLKRWGAWLDPQHPNPAQPGELRWYTTDANGDDIEVDGRGPHLLPGMDEPVLARSRTFIPATLEDNPDLAETNYKANLDSLPAELRAAYRDGNFSAGLKDDPYQIIPTEWVTAAQRRWTPNPPLGVPMTGMGVDVAIAKDKFVIAQRHDGWFDKPIVIPGHEAKDPKRMAGVVVANRRDNATVCVDVGGGWGADVYAQLSANGIDAFGYMGVKPSKRKSQDNKFSFSNVRTEALWLFREGLDPTQPGGARITLPPDAELKADLCAPSYKVKGQIGGQIIIAESKEEVCKRLGRSTDRGDAVIMAYFKGVKQANLAGGWEGGRSNRAPVVNRGRRYK